MESSLTSTVAAALPVLLVWAAAVDLLTRVIPNRLVLVLAACFAVFALLAGLDAARIASHAGCALLVLVCAYGLFAASLLGGGDAKLLAVASLWIGPDALLPFLAGTALAGGALALSYIAADFASDILRSDADTRDRATAIPYGAAIAAGGLAVMPDWLASI
ncbi:prepilin peptidase [Rhodomicrobium vannielii ATCC 17100]|uniref:A24 family peptidase n=1 Tax=Rhodomicrobium vannielii TaxID=1069 RepID=UPI00191A19E6|nr:prepilin peptidase [Rhodomicrobium vannielii]MBJ7536030.1 prepilin peptidase [Rhodomicrobium vannielii ATCC 17100]